MGGNAGALMPGEEQDPGVADDFLFCQV
jgi:hypothetical protein